MAEPSEGARRLRQYLQRKELTRAAFAERVNTTAATVSRWVSGHRLPGRASAIAIRRLTGIPASAWDPDTAKRSAAA